MDDTKTAGRSKNTRTTASRETEERPKQWTPPELLPDINKEDGKSYRYIRVSSMGQNDPQNVSSKFREGWEPVKASEHPEAFTMPDTNSQFKDSIERGGLLLCKTDEELTRQRDEHYSQKTGDVMKAVDNNYMRDQDPRMPLFNERKTKTDFGKG